MTCIICKTEIEGFGHNPDPVSPKGRCCDDCNMEFVIPTRLKECYE